jgi:hypothetical protein
MQVAYGNFSGTLKVAYVSTSQGPLKWNLGFSAGFQSKYRLVFSWSNVTSSPNLSIASKRFSVGFGLRSYTLDWSDVPSYLNTTATAIPGQFKLVIDLGTITKGSTVLVDPTIASNVDTQATANSFQRHVFYDATAGNYWVFYNNGTGISYRYSSDGVNWSMSYSVPGWPAWQDEQASTTTVLNSGRTVVVAAGQDSLNSNPSPWTGFVAVNYDVGTILGKTINWQPVQTLVMRDICNNGGTCKMLLDIWYVNLAMGSDGQLAFSFDLVDVKDISPPCSGCNDIESHTLFAYKGSLISIDSNSTYGTDWFTAFAAAASRCCYVSTVVPADSGGGMRVIYMSSFSIGISAVSFSSSGKGSTESVATDVNKWEFMTQPSADGWATLTVCPQTRSGRTQLLPSPSQAPIRL